jgi:hypothetical protein
MDERILNIIGGLSESAFQTLRFPSIGSLSKPTSAKASVRPVPRAVYRLACRAEAQRLRRLTTRGDGD